MGIFQRFLGQSTKEPDSVILQGNGSYACPVVGESSYQVALEEICGGRSRDGANYKCVAHLALEDTNPHDDKAVRIDVDGKAVGHLSRDVARQLRAQLKRSGHPRPAEITCNAIIRGGDAERPNHARGYFGVRLDIPTDGTS